MSRRGLNFCKSTIYELVSYYTMLAFHLTLVVSYVSVWFAVLFLCSGVIVFTNFA